MQEYNGFRLEYDGEGRLIAASKPGVKTIRNVYDYAGERRIRVIHDFGKTEPRVVLYPLGMGYEVRGRNSVALLTARVEIRRSRGASLPGWRVAWNNIWSIPVAV
jgi:YD repeat-containing protein